MKVNLVERYDNGQIGISRSATRIDSNYCRMINLIFTPSIAATLVFGYGLVFSSIVMSQSISLDDVIKMSDAGVDSQVITAQVHASWSCRSLSTDETIRISTAGVDPLVVTAMIECRIAEVGLDAATPDSGTVSREFALKLLQTSRFFPRPEIVELPVGRETRIDSIKLVARTIDETMYLKIDAGFRCAERLGHLIVMPTGRDLLGATLYTVNITQAGLLHGELVNQGGTFGYDQHYAYHVYGQNAIEITGLRPIDSRSQEVHFKYAISEIDRVTRCMVPQIDAQRSRTEIQARAFVALFDDGWRIERVEAAGANRDWVPLQPAHTLLMPEDQAPANAGEITASAVRESADLFDTMNKSYRSDQYTSVIDLATKLLEKRQTSTDQRNTALALRAYSFYKTGNLEESLVDITAAIEAGVDDSGLIRANDLQFILLGMLARPLEMLAYVEKNKDLSMSRAQKSNFIVYHIWALLSVDRFDQALIVMDELPRSDKRRLRAYLTFSRYLASLGMGSESALSELQLESKKRYMREEPYSEAINFLLEESSSNWASLSDDALFNVASSYCLQGKQSVAKSMYEGMFAKGEKHPDYYVAARMLTRIESENYCF